MANTLVIIVVTAVLHNFALIHREQDFDEDIEDENVLFDIIAAADASGNAKRQLIISRYFANNKINDLIKLHVRFIGNKIIKKRDH